MTQSFGVYQICSYGWKREIRHHQAERVDGRKIKQLHVCALLHAHCSVNWKRRYYQFHFTDEETEFAITELVVAKLGQNPDLPASASLCPPTSSFP